MTKTVYEIHQTIEISNDMDKFEIAKIVCSNLGVKLIQVLGYNDGFPVLNDVMTSFRIGVDNFNLDEVIRVSTNIQNELQSVGLNIIRTKIEAPARDFEYEHYRSIFSYFEAHLPIMIPISGNFESTHKTHNQIKVVVEKFGHHISRNVLKEELENFTFMITVRVSKDKSLKDFQETCSQLFDELQSLHKSGVDFMVGDYEKELVLIDTKRSHDSKWVELRFEPLGEPFSKILHENLWELYSE